MSYFSKLFFLILVIAQVAQAETIEELISAGEIEAEIVVKSAVPHYQKAPIEFTVKVGTPKEFKNGTRVRNFSIPGTFVRPTSKFAFNSTKVINGITWKYQSWSFELFAERTGPLKTPALSTFISITTESHGLVEGETKLQIPPLEISTPPGTEGLTSWFAAKEFSVEETWEGELKKHELGDAITRIRRFTIKGAAAMAIPSSPKIDLEGLQMYYAPANVNDKLVGSSLQGIREERVVFTVKAGGTYTIPAHHIDWFNLKTKAVERINFSPRTIEVSGPPVAKTTPKSDSNDKNILPWILAILGVVFSYLLLRWLSQTTAYHKLLTFIDHRKQKRRAKTAFMQAAMKRDSRQCIELLYQHMSEQAEWQISTAFSTDPQLNAVANALMAHAYGNEPAPKVSEVQRLWEFCRDLQGEQKNQNPLQLNPKKSQ